jgi:exopolysaccharide biosynthesis operon protein EpsL
MFHTNSLRQVALLLVSLGSAEAWAQDASPVTLTAAYAVQSDDNLFRRPEGVIVPTEQRADRIGITTLGLLFHTEQGLQKLEVDASLVNYQYENNSTLGSTARNYAAAWHWAVTPRLHGNLTGNQQERPDGGTFNPAPNQQTHTSYRADAEYEVDGPWHALTGVSKDKVSNQNPVTAGQEYSSTALDAGIRYDQASGSFVKVGVKVADGTYLNDTSTPANPIDSKFQQTDSTLDVHWAVSSASSAEFNASAFRRTHPIYASRDFSGLNWGASFNWSTSSKTALSLGYQHDLAAYPTVDSNYTESDHLSWGWSWQASAKTQLRFHQDVVQIAYRGLPPAAQQSTRQDQTRDTSLSWVWTPRTHWEISTAVHQIARNTNVPDLDYTSNQLSVSGQFNY